jgi:G3E family GTPase
VEAVVTVVDAVTGGTTLEWSAEARKQIILADRLIVTKMDIAGEGAGATLAAQLRALNPGAEIHEAVNGVIDPSRLTEPVSDQRNTFVAETSHSDSIGSFVLTDSRPLAWIVFARAMDTLMQLRGADLLRVKGFLDVEGCKGPVVVQFVQHLAHPPVELERWPDANRQSRVVFITRNISERQVRDLIAAIKALV